MPILSDKFSTQGLGWIPAQTSSEAYLKGGPIGPFPPLPLGAKFQNLFYSDLFYLSSFFCFQNKGAKSEEKIFWVDGFYMKILGMPLDELAPLAKICGAALACCGTLGTGIWSVLSIRPLWYGAPIGR